MSSIILSQKIEKKQKNFRIWFATILNGALGLRQSLIQYTTAYNQTSSLGPVVQTNDVIS